MERAESQRIQSRDREVSRCISEEAAQSCAGASDVSARPAHGYPAHSISTITNSELVVNLMRVFASIRAWRRPVLESRVTIRHAGGKTNDKRQATLKDAAGGGAGMS